MKTWIYGYLVGIPLIATGIAYQGYLDYKYLNDSHSVVKDSPIQKHSSKATNSSFAAAFLMGNPADKSTPEPKAVESLPETRLSFDLKGIFLSEDTALGGAVIEASPGKPAFYSIGQEISDGTTLVELMHNGVVLERGGRRETLLVKPARSGT
ncbi:type II secretion system protein N [Pseudoteredinibacter isoporae]|uniref:type II secretion system protein N n=1 Tax=Pseudoteredinibacter isoporae TaxID=570281 RepID=UPI00310A61A9